MQEVYDDVFQRRIERGNDRFIWRVLGAFGPRLAALAHFFAPPWIMPHPDLRQGEQAWVLNAAAFALTSLGRLAESADPRRASLEMVIASEDWKNAAIAGGTLCDTLLTLGRVSEALPIAQTALDHAKKSGDKQQIEFCHSHLANAQLAAGTLDDALASFQQAEEVHEERQPEMPEVYGLPGYKYGDLLLERGETDDVLRRGRYLLDLTKRLFWHGTRSSRYRPRPSADRRAQHALNQPEAKASLDAAVDGLRKAGKDDFLPQALLARAAWYRDQAAAGDNAAIEAAIEMPIRTLRKLPKSPVKRWKCTSSTSRWNAPASRWMSPPPLTPPSPPPAQTQTPPPP